MRLRSGVFARAAPVPKMPPGLVELMEGLTRDVLRHNPPDVLEFCANHMEQLVLIRDGRAPPKQRLTLEQKIKRAQEKVKERAEQRRLKYDREMKTTNQEVVDMGTSSSEAVKSDVHNSHEDGKSIEEVKDSAHSAIESKLKAPVHHEQDLTEALEVEIFHKPVANRSIITTETDSNEISQEEFAEKSENVYENIKNIEAPEEANHLQSDKKEIISLTDNDLSGMLEQVIIKENISQDSHDHIRARRSVNLVENDEVDEKDTHYVIEDLEKQKHSSENTDEVNPEIEDNNQTENLIDHINIEHVDIELKDTRATHVDIDSATVFADEVPQTAATPDKDTTNPYNDGDSAVLVVDVSKESDRTEPLIKVPEQNSAKELIITENIPLGNGKIVEIDDNIKKIALSEASTESEIKNNKNDNILEIAKNVPTIEVAYTEASHKEEKSIRENIAEQEMNISATPNISNTTEKVDHSSEKNGTTVSNNSQTVIIEETVENNIIDHNFQSNQSQLFTDSNINETSNDAQNKVILNDEEKIIKAIDELEVCDEPIEVYPDHKHENPNINEKLTSEDNHNQVEKQPTEAPVDHKGLVVESESVTEENTDGTITSIDKILVEEPGGIRDDNDSVPEQKIVENTSAEGLHINGTHEISKLEIIENGNESPEREIIPNQDVTKEAEIISDIQDDMTNTSEPLKTDLETSSLGKSSSMEDGFMDENIDTIAEVDEMKPSIELTQSKANSSSMDLETAAITIQKVFRTFLFKSRESTFDESCMGGNSIDGDSEKTEVEFPVTTAPLNKERRTLGISRMDTVLQTVNEEKSLSLSDDSSLSSAATIIQAHVRGFLTRNRLNSNKTSSSSLVNSDGPSSTSFDNDLDQKANKTVLNIHIVPEGEHFLSRDESLLTSMELSLDGSPPTSTNLHPLGYDKSEPRKQLKREDAIQSISPPSNNSGKLSEDSVKDMPIIDSDQQKAIDSAKDVMRPDADIERDDTPTKSTTIETVIEAHKLDKEASSSPEPQQEDVASAARRKRSLLKVNSDEGDVVTPFEDKSSTDSDATSRLLHSGEFHDVVLPTKVSRGDTSVVRGE